MQWEGAIAAHVLPPRRTYIPAGHSPPRSYRAPYTEQYPLIFYCQPSLPNRCPGIRLPADARPATGKSRGGLHACLARGLVPSPDAFSPLRTSRLEIPRPSRLQISAGPSVEGLAFSHEPTESRDRFRNDGRRDRQLFDNSLKVYLPTGVEGSTSVYIIFASRRNSK